MGSVRMILEHMTRVYAYVFADWLYIPFVARTLIVLLVLWVAVYMLAQVFHYVLAPLVILFVIHIPFRLWNFLFVETLQEWIYIHYHAWDKPTFDGAYRRLSDAVRRNRTLLARTGYTHAIKSGGVRRAAARLMTTVLVLFSLTTLVLGLYGEYGYVTAVSSNTATGSNSLHNSGNGSNTASDADGIMDENAADDGSGASDDTDSLPTQRPGDIIVEDGASYVDVIPDPSEWPDNATVSFRLSRRGVDGTNVRDKPSAQNSVVLEVVWGAELLTYAGAYAVDEDDDTILWIKVQTTAGTEGYVSSVLLSVVSVDG